MGYFISPRDTFLKNRQFSKHNIYLTKCYTLPVEILKLSFVISNTFIFSIDRTNPDCSSINYTQVVHNLTPTNESKILFQCLQIYSGSFLPGNNVYVRRTFGKSCVTSRKVHKTALTHNTNNSNTRALSHYYVLAQGGGNPWRKKPSYENPDSV